MPFVIDIDPVAFALFGIPVRWYGLILVAAAAVAVWLAQREGRRRGIDTERQAACTVRHQTFRPLTLESAREERREGSEPRVLALWKKGHRAVAFSAPVGWNRRLAPAGVIPAQLLYTPRFQPSAVAVAAPGAAAAGARAITRRPLPALPAGPPCAFAVVPGRDAEEGPQDVEGDRDDQGSPGPLSASVGPPTRSMTVPPSAPARAPSEAVATLPIPKKRPAEAFGVTRS